MSRTFFIDDDECIADGSCADICPGCFHYEKGMRTAQVTGFDCDEKLIQEAMDTCPTKCIHWQESNTQ